MIGPKDTPESILAIKKNCLIDAINKGNEATIDYLSNQLDLFTPDILTLAQEKGTPSVTRKIVDIMIKKEPGF